MSLYGLRLIFEQLAEPLPAPPIELRQFTEDDFAAMKMSQADWDAMIPTQEDWDRWLGGSSPNAPNPTPEKRGPQPRRCGKFAAYPSG
jgi:hypothetical protein